MSSSSNPFQELQRFFERMNRQIEESSRSWDPNRPFWGWAGGESMAIDLLERDGEFVATVDLPGFEREDVSVEVSDHTLRIEAEHEETTETEGERHLRRERRHESAERSIRLPDEVEKDDVTATMEHGVLTVTLPKLEAEEPKTIEIEAE